jgi:heme-degrading monooxygenase HmoA
MVVFVNKLVLTGSAEDLESIYADVSTFFAAQPGLIRFQLLRSGKDPSVYINIAEWESAELFRQAVSQEKFQTSVRVSEVSVGDPHLCEVVLRGEPA